MGREARSQWDFGELFQQQATPPQTRPGAAQPPARVPSQPSRKILSVTELTWQIKRLLEKEVGQVWVTGEITNLRAQSSGHIYFTLKDAGAQMNCVLFRGETQADRSLLQDGRKVTLEGEVTVYEPRGQYQLRVTRVELQGLGALQAAFEKLKQKLQAEGLFATERKRPLPRYPRRIGLVTSPTGAAIRDVLHVIQRRNPGLEIILAPSRVQGEGAAEEISEAIGLLNAFHANAADSGAAMAGTASRCASAVSLDLILVTRGGGSLEDLWAFNEEVVARAIFNSALPVVSAVGHEIDFTISDFVADVRAATPSAAAEIITEGVFSSSQFLSAAAARIRQLTLLQLGQKQRGLFQTDQRLARLHPRRRLGDWLQRLDEAHSSILRCARQGMRRQQLAWQTLSERLVRVRPALVLKQRREVIDQASQRLREQARHRLREQANRVKVAAARLKLLGPEQVLARGYSITMDDQTGKIVRAAEAVQTGQRLKTRLKSGLIRSRVEG